MTNRTMIQSLVQTLRSVELDCHVMKDCPIVLMYISHVLNCPMVLKYVVVNGPIAMMFISHVMKKYSNDSFWYRFAWSSNSGFEKKQK